jgi:predicted rRNA methylase YqxC with S4 and FtsJ domains
MEKAPSKSGAEPAHNRRMQVTASSAVDIRAEVPKFVSRAGFKLEKALETFRIPVEGLVCLDSGLSTGGFTDCLLQHGASQARHYPGRFLPVHFADPSAWASV